MLDHSTLAMLVGLCEAGVNPKALAAVVKEHRREGQALEVRARARLQCPLPMFTRSHPVLLDAQDDSQHGARSLRGCWFPQEWRGAARPLVL